MEVAERKGIRKMSDNPDDAILKIIGQVALGIVIAPFVLVGLQAVKLAQWVQEKVTRKGR